MSWKRANAAGAKQQTRNDRDDRRVSNKPEKCQRPGCSSKAKAHGVCGSSFCSAWYVADGPRRR